jgi:hypothetical protein
MGVRNDGLPFDFAAYFELSMLTPDEALPIYFMTS